MQHVVFLLLMLISILMNKWSNASFLFEKNCIVPDWPNIDCLLNTASYQTAASVLFKMFQLCYKSLFCFIITFPWGASLKLFLFPSFYTNYMRCAAIEIMFLFHHDGTFPVVATSLSSRQQQFMPKGFPKALLYHMMDRAHNLLSNLVSASMQSFQVPGQPALVWHGWKYTMWYSSYHKWNAISCQISKTLVVWEGEAVTREHPFRKCSP